MCTDTLVCVDSLLEGHIMMANHEAQKNTVLLKTFKTINFFFTLETFVVNYTLTIIFICHFERCKRGNSHNDYYHGGY